MGRRFITALTVHTVTMRSTSDNISSNMPPSLAEQFYEAGQELTASSAPDTAGVSTDSPIVSFPWPFRAATGSAVDSEGHATGTFGTLIYTRAGNEAVVEPGGLLRTPLPVSSSISETIDSGAFRAAYERISEQKSLRNLLLANSGSAAHNYYAWSHTYSRGVCACRNIGRGA